jgi:hypothetical protein
MSCEHNFSNLNKIEGEQKPDPLQTLKTLMTKLKYMCTLKTLSPMQGFFPILWFEKFGKTFQSFCNFFEIYTKFFFQFFLSCQYKNSPKGKIKRTLGLPCVE